MRSQLSQHISLFVGSTCPSVSMVAWYFQCFVFYFVSLWYYREYIVYLKRVCMLKETFTRPKWNFIYCWLQAIKFGYQSDRYRKCCLSEKKCANQKFVAIDTMTLNTNKTQSIFYISYLLRWVAPITFNALVANFMKKNFL